MISIIGPAPFALTAARSARAPSTISAAVCSRKSRNSSIVGSFARPSSAHCAVRSTAHRPNASRRRGRSRMARASALLDGLAQPPARRMIEMLVVTSVRIVGEIA